MQMFSPIQYLKIDIASNFGLDKLDWDQRLAWVDEHEDHIEDMLPQADTPALYHAGVQAFRKTQRGEPTGYPISLDAASSGLQLLAVLAGCEASARLCGVVPTGHREDAYTVIYQTMCTAIGDTAKIERKDCKAAVMTSLYSSTAEPKRVFGEGALLATFYDTMETMAPGAWALNYALQTLWQPYATSHDWVLPDNFHAHCKVTKSQTEYVQFLNTPVPVTFTVNEGTRDGKSISPNLIHSIDGMIVREMHRRCSYDRDQMIELIEIIHAENFGPETRSQTRSQDQLLMTLWGHYQASGFLSARVLDLIDAKNIGLVDYSTIKKLIKSLPDLPFPILSIHDAFRCHPNYGNDLRAQYNRILSEISASDLLSFVASQVAGKPMPVNKLGDISAQILEADYTLC